MAFTPRPPPPSPLSLIATLTDHRTAVHTVGFSPDGRLVATGSGDRSVIVFIELDRYVAWRTKRLLIKRRGRNLRAGHQGQRWTRSGSTTRDLTSYGTIRYPKAA